MIIHCNCFLKECVVLIITGSPSEAKKCAEEKSCCYFHFIVILNVIYK